MPNLAATEARGAVSRRMRSLSFALFCPVIACGVVHLAIPLGAEPGPVTDNSARPVLLPAVALPIALYRARHRIF